VKRPCQIDLEQVEIDQDRRALIAALTAGVIFGPVACGPTREQPQNAATQKTPKGDVADVAEGDTRPVLPGVEPEVRIRVTKVRREGAKGQPIGLTLGEKGQRLWVTTPELPRPGRVVYGPLLITAANGGWLLQSEGRRRHGRELIETATPLAMTAIARRPIGYNGKQLEGTLRLFRRTDLGNGDFDLVTHVAMETYLPGVLQSELYQNWPEATFEAQAIAARSYGCCERSFWRRRRHYDVVAGPASQAWSGGEASPRARSAVMATSGLVLVWKGRMIPAYYSAACGGLPASGSDAIGKNPANAVRPLSVQSVSQRRDRGCCEDSPYASWTVEFDRANVVRALAKYGREHGRRDLAAIRRIDAIEVINRNPAGRPTRYRLASRQPLELGAEALRRALNTAGSEGEGESPLRASCIEFRTTSKGIEAQGRGFGHGVGLCQYGARSMGRAGADSAAILARYYPGATVQRGWEASRGSEQLAGA
jgi:stage II sporulation protein D